MRVWWALFLLIPISGIAAQADEPLGEDDTGDVASGLGTAGATTMDEVDLVSIDVMEDPEQLFFVVGVRDLNEESSPDVLASAYEVIFAHNGEVFQLYTGRNNVFGGGQWWGELRKYDNGTDHFFRTGYLQVTADYDENTVTFAVDRDRLRDGSGAVPSLGRQLDQFFVSTHANRLTERGVEIQGDAPDPAFSDRLPDTGVLDKAYDVIEGVATTGHGRLMSFEPFRASNGAATTYLFYLEAHNSGTKADKFSFQSTNAPGQWELTLPGEIEIEAGGQQSVPIIVNTAFAHNHGGEDAVTIAMHSQSDASAIARIEIGVYYPLIPQPAGHHDTVWFHSINDAQDEASAAIGTVWGQARGETGGLQREFMNALQDDESADDVPAEGRRCNFVMSQPGYTVGTQYCWGYPLSPGLVMGLDFDLERLGQLEIDVGTPLSLPDASIEGILWHLGPWEGRGGGFPLGGGGGDREFTALAYINSTTAVSVETTKTITTTVTPTKDSDLIEYQPYSSLYLDLRLTTSRPESPAGPALPPPTIRGGWMQLPLNEYADPVEGVFAAVPGGLTLDPIGAQERAIHAGKTIIFKAELNNKGNTTDVGLDIVGANREWAEVLADPEIRMLATETRTIAVAVTAPDGALDGEMADLVLEVSNLNDINDRTLVRFVATVDSTAAVDDESVLEDGLFVAAEKESPGVPLVLLLAGLVAWAAHRR